MSNDNILTFQKPYVLVTRSHWDTTGYDNPTQRYFEYDNVSMAFKGALNMRGNEQQPIALLRELEDGRVDYFHNFVEALNEVRNGTRSIQ